MRTELSDDAEDDVFEQYVYYSAKEGAPLVATRFREAVRDAVLAAARNPLAGLRKWSVSGFPLGVYYLVQGDVLRVVRVLHGKRNLERILSQQGVIRRGGSGFEPSRGS